MNGKLVLKELNALARTYNDAGELEQAEAVTQAIKIVQTHAEAVWHNGDERPDKSGDYLFDNGHTVAVCCYNKPSNLFYTLSGERFVVISPKAWRKMPTRGEIFQKLLDN